MTTLQSSPRVAPHGRNTTAIIGATLSAIVVAAVLALSLILSGGVHGRTTPQSRPTMFYSTAGHQGVAALRDRGQHGSGARTTLPSVPPNPCTTDNCRNRR